MPPKRKLQVVNKDASFSGDSPYSKRPRRSAVNQSELAQSIFDVLKDFEDENGHLIADSFMKLPSKRQNPDYYEKIVDPVDLTKIGQRIRMDEYRDIEILTTDMQLMVSNAKKYYPEDSQEYTDACNLWEIYLNTKDRILEEAKYAEPTKHRIGRRPRPRRQFSEEAASDFEPETEVSVEELKEIYESLTTEVDENDRVFSQLFMQLPDKANVQYYETIKEPIDFFTISNRIEDGNYSTVNDFEKDVKMLVKNAKVFNEPGSKIYEDALKINHLLKEKIIDFERGKKQEISGVKTSARIKHRRSWGRTPEKSIDKKDDMKAKHDVCIPDPSEDDFQALFYNAVVNFRNPNGHTIADPFVRLPNKRFYPMYYEEIENPISLKIIRKKILSRKYDTCTDLQEDFNLLFENAMQFNIASSQIHKDAVSLQKFMTSKTPDYAAKEEECMEEESESEDEENDEEEADENATGIKTEHVTSSASDSNEGKIKKKRRKRRAKTSCDLLQERLRMLYDCVMEAEDVDGRERIALFLEKPSRKDYPDYYKLVLEPIDMKTIDKKIRQDKYTNVEDMLEDFSLMFNNARHYNEPGSEVFVDANDLEKLLLEKHREAGALPDIEEDGSPTFSSSRSTKKNTDSKLEQLFASVRDYQDATKRMICDIFMQLPTKQELPDYYKVIKKPMEMDRIQQKMQGGHYVKLDEMLLDMLLMFENGCTYNEPGSVIYKDALILQKVALETFYKLEKPETLTPPAEMVNEIMTNLFVSVMGHQDESGRCYSESLSGQQNEGEVKPLPGQESDGDHQTLQTVQVNEGTEKLTLEVIRKNLRNRRYKRLDVFQEHMFEVFENIRNTNRTDSETYEDVVELQKFFIRIRDELCKNGETLMSTALAFTAKMLDAELDQEKKEKLPLEAKEDEEIREEGKELREKMQMSTQAEEMDIQGTRYNVGDFVYVENPEPLKPHHIVCIEKLYTDDTGERRLYGVWFLRPEATYHFPSKKFMLKEVFKSDYYNTVPVSLIRGRCFVMLGKDYFKLKPNGFQDEDVYVCESRYSSRAKSFKRIKFLQLPPNNTELVQRETALPVIRMPSCYSETKPPENSLAQSKGQMLLTQGIDPAWPTDEIPKERENIKTDAQNPHSEATYYSQYFVKNMWIKLGDCVYVKQSNSHETKISRVERLWTDSHGNVWLHGPWFVRPTSVEHEPTRMFYKNELFLSSVEDTFPIAEVVGKCLVMAHKDYCACRPTELPEKDIYLYESRYADKIIKKIKVKRYAPSFKVVDDEYYYYKKPIVVEYVLSPQLTQLVQNELISRENEARIEAAKASAAIAEGQVVPMQGYHPSVNQPMYQQGMQPQVQGYIQQQGIVPQYQYQGYQGSPATGQHPHPHGALPNAHYMGQQYTPNQGFPSPHPGVVQHPHMQPYQNSPQPYASSPHPNMIASSPGMFQSPDNSRPSSAHPEAAPTPPPKKKGRGGHSTGYILFASHCHPRVRAENPDMAFGEISKIVGEEWRGLEEDKKREYEEKAREHTAKLEAEGKLVVKKKKKKKDADETLSQASTPQPSQQYATPYQPQSGQYAAMQHPQQQRMQMHPGGTPHAVQPGAPGYPSSASPMTPYGQTPGQYPQPQQTPAQPPTLAEKHRLRRGALFVKPPPKAQRVMHSEAYLRYIEGLEKGSKTVSNWSRSMKVKERDIIMSREEEERLPVHWLGNGKGQHETAKSALWALRDYMLKDALTIKQSL
uniref:Protein polybromo-1 n=1 Tax=Phallusia mammillata TaxID=59560 RepID=A0A6F9DMK6_9ASCI|nr:protein polybromo-1 [Phallusia mammillata]